MDDFLQLYELTETYPSELEKLSEEWLVKLRVILWGPAAGQSTAKDAIKDLAAASPQQTKKRVKRLASLNEENGEELAAAESNNNKKLSKGGYVSPRRSKRSNAELLAVAEQIHVSEEIKENALALRKNEDEASEVAAESTERKSDASNLMPPPPAPATTAPAEETHSGRPQRAAKLKSEKNLKEPKLNTKMRCPSESNVKVKLEHEQRASQIHENSTQIAATTVDITAKSSLSSEKSNDSVVIVPGKKPSTVDINSQSEEEEQQLTKIMKDTDSQQEAHREEDPAAESTDASVRSLRIKIKREKVSLQPQEEKTVTAPSDNATFKAPESVPPSKASTRSDNSTLEESSMTSSILSSTTNTSSATGKKPRKKKDAAPHRPIKVERFSDLDPKPSPVASRTRHGSMGLRLSQHDNNDVAASEPVSDEVRRPASVYEDAVETPPSRNSKVASGNETVNLGPTPASDATINFGSMPGDSTFQVTSTQTTFVLDSGNPNATVTLNKQSGPIGDATFEVHSLSKNEKDDDVAGQRSFETAKDSSVPHDDSLITEDESCEPTPPLPAKPKPSSSAKAVATSASAKALTSAKAGYKMPARANELFNPLAQSPVKMRVEAFENAAAAAATEQPKRPLRNKKENITPTSSTTPIIGKLPAPALGRFLTPTQSSNVSSVGSAYAKKVTTSASKASSVIKTGSATLQRTASTASNRTLQRENSADDFRKGLHNLAEERKKQREQKHLLAAQQREAKERERAERMAKLAKEREEKRLQKIQEQEQKKREMEEIQRKLRLQQEEEAARLKAAKEREMLLQMKQHQQMVSRQKMLPPPPKTASKYVFEMLHEDDSTDDEDKVSYKRPPPPSWSRSHKRGAFVLKQEYTPSSYIDCFFSVQPLTADLKQIFPNIDARYLKRNSSVLWSTPPRYSELPKY